MIIAKEPVVSRNIKHDSAVAHVSGQAEYVDDMPRLQGQLFVAIGGSSIACGEVSSIDLQAVRQSEGVVDVITVEDLPAHTDIGPVFPGDPLLSKTIACYGQAIFAVAAKSQAQARRAIGEAIIEYAEAEPLLDIQQGIDNQDFVRPAHSMTKGDAAQAIADAPHSLTGVQQLGGQEHFYLEGQVALAVPGENGAVTVYSSNQNPTEAQKLVAEVLGLSMRQVTIVTRRMGGGFGGKETQGAAPACLAAVFAARNRVAVGCRLSRRDDMVMTGKRHPFQNRYTVGYDEQGQIAGIEYQLAGQCGHSPDLSDAIVDRAMFHCDNAYFLPAVSIEGLRVRSNTVSNTAFRGFGGPQGMLVMEAVIDEVAFALGKDPLDIRKLNLYGTQERNVTPYGQTVKAYTVPTIIEQLEQSSDYRARKRDCHAFNQQNQVLKKGIALTPVKFGISFTVKHLNQAGALLHLYSDGSFHLNHGGTEMGQGLMIKVAQIVANVFCVDVANIEVSATRTDKVPNTSATAASSGTDLNGMAASIAAETIRQRLVEYLAEAHAVLLQDIMFTHSGVVVGEKTLSLAEVANQAYMARVSLSATGFYRTPDIHYDRATARGQPFYYYANGAAVSEVIIDTLTGENKLLRTDILHDVGNSINPAIDIGQIEGGFVQGAGWLTSEEVRWDERGRLTTDGPANYKIPAVADRPPVFNVSLLADTPNSVPTVLRSKAVGEPPLMLAISVHSAIRDAVASTAEYAHCPVLNAPATPEEILRAISACRSAREAG